MFNNHSKSFKCALIRKLQLAMAVFIVFTGLHSVTANAAAPILTVKTSNQGAALPADASNSKKPISNLRIINLEQPSPGSGFDVRATVMTDEGIFWEIPVLWVDEYGNVSTVYVPGKKYTPIFAFYIPESVLVSVNSSIGGYTVKLPEYLSDCFSSEDLVIIADPSKNISFITSINVTRSVDSSENPKTLSLLLSSSTVSEFFNSNKNTQAYDFVSYEEKNRIPQPQNSVDEASDDSGDKRQSYAESQVTPIAPPEPFIDELVRIHCSNKVIEKFGNDNLKALLDLIINVIEPQAVNVLAESFPAFKKASESMAEGGPDEIGRSIGLYIYSDIATDDPDWDIPALAFVYGDYTDHEDEDSIFGYFVGVDIESVYRPNENGIYEISEDDLIILNNTIVHEMMHAFMYDYNRTGMLGAVPDDSEFRPGDNEFPLWFLEGTASSVDNTYAYRSPCMELMYDTAEEKYTATSFIDYYSNLHKGFWPWLYYEPVNLEDLYSHNELRDYVSGYFATLYLSKLAQDHEIKMLKSEDLGADGLVQCKEVSEDTNSRWYNNEGFTNGLSIILELLHNGSPLNAIINDISDGRYTDIKDFEKKFVYNKEEDRIDVDSLEFCTDFLNYLDECTKALKEREPDYKYNVSGSILIPFDSDKTSAIDGELPIIEDQIFYNIVDSQDLVPSTVSNEVAFSSAGVVCVAFDEDNDDSENENAAPEREAGTGSLTEEQLLVAKPVMEIETNTDTNTDTENVDGKDSENVTDTVEDDIVEQVLTIDDEPSPEETSLEETSPEETSPEETAEADTSTEEDIYFRTKLGNI